MAVTIAVVSRNVEGATRVVTLDVTGPATYTAGGETLTAAQQGAILGEPPPAAADFTKVRLFLAERDASGRQLALDKANNKMLFFLAGAEAGAINLSAVTLRCRVSFGQTNTG